LTRERLSDFNAASLRTESPDCSHFTEGGATPVSTVGRSGSSAVLQPLQCNCALAMAIDCLASGNWLYPFYRYATPSQCHTPPPLPPPPPPPSFPFHGVSLTTLTPFSPSSYWAGNDRQSDPTGQQHRIARIGCKHTVNPFTLLASHIRFSLWSVVTQY
jgi:hypothetical protein